MRHDLARGLLAMHEHQAVAEYWQVVLRDFTPGRLETLDLLERATVNIQ